MKTRREFFKTLAGSMAVVAACVMAPKSLIAEAPEWETVYWDDEFGPIGRRELPPSGRITVTTTTSGAFGDSVEIKEYNHASEWTGKTWLPYKGD